MFSSKFSSRRQKRYKYLQTETLLTIAVISLYFIYKATTVTLPTDVTGGAALETGDGVAAVQPTIRSKLRQLPAVQRDVLSVREPQIPADPDEDKLDSFLNLGRWNSSDSGAELQTAEPSPVRKELDAIISQKLADSSRKAVGSPSVKNISSVDYGPVGRGIKYIDDLHASLPIVSRHNFNYIINPEDFCEGQDLHFITYVHTAAKYTDRRNHIRRTWGDPKPHSVKFKVLFVLGANGDPEVQKGIEAESKQYGDILQEDFIDTYRNLTHKGLAALKWIEKYCSHAKYVLKTDDDTFVNTYTYIRYLQSIDRMGTDTGNMILCAVWNQMTVSRKGKWSVTNEQFHDSSYPTYCSGCAFTFTMDVAIAIYKVSYHVPFFWVDDAYITGVLPRRIGKIKHRNCRSTYEMNSDKLKEKFTGSEWWRYIFSSDIHRFNEADEVWDTVTKLFTAKRTDNT